MVFASPSFAASAGAARALGRGRPRPNDVWLLEALVAHVAPGATVLVVGSGEPWHESLCIALGAKRARGPRGGSRRFWS